jgi:hypothetical protein
MEQEEEGGMKEEGRARHERSHIGVRCLVLFALLLNAGAANAQTSYVTLSLGTDFSQVASSVRDGAKGDPPDGFALGTAVRAGTPFGERWGAEVEFATARAIAHEQRSANVSAALAGIPIVGGVYSIRAVAFHPGEEPPPPVFHVSATHRNSTFNTLGWVSKEVAGDVDLVVLFGLGLRRTSTAATISTDPPDAASVTPRSASATTYDVGPVVGADLRIRLSDRWRLVPSARLQGLADGWLLRTTAGVSWVF